MGKNGEGNKEKTTEKRFVKAALQACGAPPWPEIGQAEEPKPPTLPGTGQNRGCVLVEAGGYRTSRLHEARRARRLCDVIDKNYEIGERH